MALLTILRTCPACQRRVVRSTGPVHADKRQPFACPACKTSLRVHWPTRLVLHLWLLISDLLLFLGFLPLLIVVGGWLSGWNVSEAVGHAALWASLAFAGVLASFVVILSLYPIRIRHD